METLWEYARVFLVGGALCVIGQLLIDHTRLTPARILTGYVVAGVVLGALGLYGPLAEWAGAGATVPLTGFGWIFTLLRLYLIYKGMTSAFNGREDPLPYIGNIGG